MGSKECCETTEDGVETPSWNLPADEEVPRSLFCFGEMAREEGADRRGESEVIINRTDTPSHTPSSGTGTNLD